MTFPFAPINTIEKVFKDEHVIHSGIVKKDVEHTTAGKIPLVGHPVKYSGDKGVGEIRMAPPVLGEHTREILEGVVGYGDDVIEDLIECGVVKDGSC